MSEYRKRSLSQPQLDFKFFTQLLFNLFEDQVKQSDKKTDENLTVLELYGLVWIEISAYFHLASRVDMDNRMHGFTTPFQSADGVKKKPASRSQSPLRSKTQEVAQI